MNALLVIHPYRDRGAWVFDDARVGLDKEPFVAGADVIIDDLVASLPNAARGFTLVFAAAPFPGHQVKLIKFAEEYGGTWYRADTGREGWLCPALFKYFETAPEYLYAQAKSADA
jgi:hypothetical protein